MAVKLPRIVGLRIIGVSVDAGAATHVGGPVHIQHATFDVPCPTDLEFWFQHGGREHQRSIQGVELLFDRDTK